MMRNSVLLLALTLLVACAGLPGPSNAQNTSLNLLIMGEDHDQDTIPRGSRVFRRVFDTMSNQLHNEGFNVYDEAAVTLGDFEQGRTRRSDIELMEIAKQVRRPPIDVIVLFQIYSGARPNLSRTATMINTRIAGRMLNPHSGRRLGNFEVSSPGNWMAPVECNRECVIETVGDHASALGRDLGAVLATQLRHQVSALRTPEPIRDTGATPAPGGNGLAKEYVLRFVNFTAPDILDMEEYLKIFSGYRNHRPIEQSFTASTFWYESAINPGKLRRNIDRMLAELDVTVRVVVDGDTYTIEQLNLRRERARPTADNW